MIRMSNLYSKLHLWFFNLILWLKKLLHPCDCRNRSVFLKNHYFSKFEIFICATFFTAKGQTQFFQKKWFNWWNCETLFVIYIYNRIYITFCVGYYSLQIWIMCICQRCLQTLIRASYIYRKIVLCEFIMCEILLI